MDDFVSIVSSSNNKRAAVAADPAAHPAKVRRVESATAAAQSVGELLDEADAFEVEELDAASLKRSLLLVSVLLFTVTFYANRAHNLTRSP